MDELPRGTAARGKAFDSAREAEREALGRLTKAAADLLEQEQGTAKVAEEAAAELERLR